MKRSTFLMLFLLYSFSMTLSAQSTNETRAIKATERMSKQLNLTEAQQETIRAGYLNMYRQITELRAQQNEQSDLKSSRQSINDEFDKLLSNTLTKEQLENWQQQQKVRNSKPTPKQGPSPKVQEEQIKNAADQKTKKMTRQLSLTEEQQTKVRQALVTKLTKTRALRSMVKSDREGTKIARKKINTDYDAAIMNILTEEQKKQKSVIEQQRKVKRSKIKSSQQNSGRKMNSTNSEIKVDAHINHMAEKLDLSTDQKTSFKEAYLEKVTSLEQLKGAKPEGKKDKHKKIIDQYNEKLATFLSAEQLESMQKSAHKKIKMD